MDVLKWFAVCALVHMCVCVLKQACVCLRVYLKVLADRTDLRGVRRGSEKGK